MIEFGVVSAVCVVVPVSPILNSLLAVLVPERRRDGLMIILDFLVNNVRVNTARTIWVARSQCLDKILVKGDEPMFNGIQQKIMNHSKRNIFAQRN